VGADAATTAPRTAAQAAQTPRADATTRSVAGQAAGLAGGRAQGFLAILAGIAVQGGATLPGGTARVEQGATDMAGAEAGAVVLPFLTPQSAQGPGGQVQQVAVQGGQIDPAIQNGPYQSAGAPQPPTGAPGGPAQTASAPVLQDTQNTQGQDTPVPAGAPSPARGQSTTGQTHNSAGSIAQGQAEAQTPPQTDPNPQGAQGQAPDAQASGAARTRAGAVPDFLGQHIQNATQQGGQPGGEAGAGGQQQPGGPSLDQTVAPRTGPTAAQALSAWGEALTTAQTAHSPAAPTATQGTAGALSQAPSPPAGAQATGQAAATSAVHPASQALAVTLQQRAGEGGARQFTVQMDPPELGRVDVKLQFGRDKTLRAVLTVEKPETLTLLQRDAQALERSLQGSGLQSGADLEFSLAQGGQGDARDYDGHQAGAGQGGFAPAPDEKAAPDGPQHTGHRSGRYSVVV
jgi:flagellar hook-length control protein FliK